MQTTIKGLAAALAAILAGAALHAGPTSHPRSWSSVWYAPAFLVADTKEWGFAQDYAGQTVRQVLRIGATGERLRIRFGNATGTVPLRIASASFMRLSQDRRSAEPVPLTFHGDPSAVAAAGAPLYADPVAIKLHQFDEIAVSVHFASGPPVFLSGHLEQVIAAPGDWVLAPNAPTGATTIDAPSAIESVELTAREAVPVLVAIGDSITEGLKSSPGLHRSWPELFANRLARNENPRWSVINAGISGNRLLSDRAGPNLLARFDRDALNVCGASAVIVLIGINDIMHGPKGDAIAGPQLVANDLIAGYRQLIARAHQRGLPIYGGTILPFMDPRKAQPEAEATRVAVNHWIRSSNAFDGVIDFDRGLRDPADPRRMRAAYDSGDHVHPGDRGYQQMASLLPLSIAARHPSRSAACR